MCVFFYSICVRIYFVKNKKCFVCTSMYIPGMYFSSNQACVCFFLIQYAFIHVSSKHIFFFSKIGRFFFTTKLTKVSTCAFRLLSKACFLLFLLRVYDLGGLQTVVVFHVKHTYPYCVAHDVFDLWCVHLSRRGWALHHLYQGFACILITFFVFFVFVFFFFRVYIWYKAMEHAPGNIWFASDRVGIYIMYINIPCTHVYIPCICIYTTARPYRPLA